MMRTKPRPFMTVAEATAEVDVFIGRLHDSLDDTITEWAEEFITRVNPELSSVIDDVVHSGSSIDALEATPEYDLFYATLSSTITHVLRKFAEQWDPYIYGQINYRARQRERAMEGAPE
jgi:hypothetical protein